MQRRILRVVLAAAVAGVAASDCGEPPAVRPDGGDDAARPYLPIAAFPEMPVPVDNPMTDARVELGRQLFHDPLLSSDRTVACVTCHGEIWGMSDGLPLSVGIGGHGPPGPGRVGPNLTRRNAITLWNDAWRASLFWDGRASSLESQVVGPLMNPHELDRDPSSLVNDLVGAPMYAPLFAAAFPGAAPAITEANVYKALASFERTLVSDHAPFDEWAHGDRGALDADEIEGWRLFNEVGCATCHVPPLFEREAFTSSGAPAVVGIDDAGRYEVTHLEADRGHYRVPTLRNLRVTGPYFHNGTATDVETAILWEINAGHARRTLSTAEIAGVALFLRQGLMDITRVPVRPTIAPSGLPVPADTLEIPRNGQSPDGGS